MYDGVLMRGHGIMNVMSRDQMIVVAYQSIRKGGISSGLMSSVLSNQGNDA